MKKKYRLKRSIVISFYNFIGYITGSIGAASFMFLLFTLDYDSTNVSAWKFYFHLTWVMVLLIAVTIHIFNYTYELEERIK